jgi:hypothetical protein
MGPLTGLATISAVLATLLVVSAVVVVGLGLAVVVPAIRESHRARVRGHVSIPAWYLHPAAAH